MSDDIDALMKVTALLRERALEQYRRDLAEEVRLQAEKDRIDALRMQVFSADQALDARRLTGADTLWQGWLAGRRGQLNQEIAMARARQAHSINAARAAFSRDEAAKDMAHREAVARGRARLAAEEVSLEALSRLSARFAE